MADTYTGGIDVTDTTTVAQEEYYARVPKPVVYHPDLTGNDVRVYATLSERAGSSRRSWPGVRRIAKDLAMSPTTVQSALDKLEDFKLIEVERSKGMVNHYFLPILGVSESGTPPYQNLAQGVSESGTELDQRTTTPPNGGTSGLFEAFYEFWTGNPYVTGQTKVPKSMRGRLNAAVKEARDADISAGEVWARGEQYRRTWSDMERTPQALLANWHRFEPYKEVPECDVCDNRGLVAVDADGEYTFWDDPESSVNVACPECAT
jgi:hypothetical protein